MIRQPDERRLEKIVKYCDLVLDTTLSNGMNYDDIVLKLSKDIVFQTSISMMLVQVGELVRHLSDEIKAQFAEVPWKTISGMRNRLGAVK